jgi:hypothetical protein
MEYEQLAIVWRSIVVFRLNSCRDNEFFPRLRLDDPRSEAVQEERSSYDLTVCRRQERHILFRELALSSLRVGRSRTGSNLKVGIILELEWSFYLD